MRKLTLIILFFALITSNNLLAWGADGHKIVASIAKTILNKEIADSVQFYLEEISFEGASVWMDEVRSNPKYDYLKPKHYINIEKDKTYVKVETDNIVNELESVLSQLQNRKNISKAETKMALLILFHLAGDLHQPLHVGYADDKGGNTIKVTFNDKNSNLHRVWDSEIIEHEKINLAVCLEQYSKYSKNEIKKLNQVNFVEWTNDSRTFLKDVYDFNGTELNSGYFSKNKTIVQTQLIKAGVRLASTLNLIFNKKN